MTPEEADRELTRTLGKLADADGEPMVPGGKYRYPASNLVFECAEVISDVSRFRIVNSGSTATYKMYNGRMRRVQDEPMPDNIRPQMGKQYRLTPEACLKYGMPVGPYECMAIYDGYVVCKGSGSTEYTFLNEDLADGLGAITSPGELEYLKKAQQVLRFLSNGMVQLQAEPPKSQSNMVVCDSMDQAVTLIMEAARARAEEGKRSRPIDVRKWDNGGVELYGEDGSSVCCDSMDQAVTLIRRAQREDNPYRRLELEMMLGDLRIELSERAVQTGADKMLIANQAREIAALQREIRILKQKK